MPALNNLSPKARRTPEIPVVFDFPQEGFPLYKIAIAGASSLLGKELKDVLSDSPLAAARFVLLDEDVAQGQLDQVGDEVTFIQAISADAFDDADFTFFCGSEDLTLKHWRKAADAGSTVMTGTGTNVSKVVSRTMRVRSSISVGTTVQV